MKKLYTISMLVAIIFSNGLSYGQSGSFTLLSPDSRNFALGGNSVAVVSNAFAFYNNSASVLFSEDKSAFAGSFTSWLPDSQEATLIGGAGYIRTGAKTAISVGYSSISYADIELSDVNGNRTGTFTPSEYSVGAGFSYLLSERLSASANFKYISSDIGGESAANALAADVNLFYSYNSLRLGLTASNLGSSLDYGNGTYALPANLRLGTGYIKNISELSSLMFTVSAGMTFENSSFMAGAGAEYVYNKIFALRIGGHYGDEEKGIPPYVSAGAGINIYGVNLNFAYLAGKSDSPVNNTFSIGLGYNF